MIVLGVNAFFESPSACLVQDGRLAAFCQEDRFTRLKGSAGHFPSHAVSWCLKSRNLKLEDVDRIAVSWDCRKYPFRMLRALARMKWSCRGRVYVHPPSIPHASGPGPALDYLYQHTPGAFERGIRDALRTAGFHAPTPRIEFVEHHLAHAYAAFFQSPFQEAAVLVADGSGEERTVSAYSARAGSLRLEFAYEIPQSLGWFYGGFTAYLGFRPNRDEGKLMGLAALGECRKQQNPWLRRLDRILRITPAGFELDPRFLKLGGNEFHPHFPDQLFRFVTSCNPELVPVGVDEMAGSHGDVVHRYLLEGYVDLAYAVQNRLEEAMVSLVRRLTCQTGLRKVCLAGGVAMNCKANGAVAERAGIDELFVHPAASDDGTAIGAALIVAAQAGDKARNPLPHVQWGPCFSNAEVEEAFRFAGCRYATPGDICAAAAEIVARGGIAGWFQGGAEMGARALGGRSIIACPGDPAMKEKLNRNVKRREHWRPYAPSLASESRKLYFEGGCESPFMVVARVATPLAREAAAAAVHVDGTLRPQTVSPEALPRWHGLLKAVERFTGHALVLNTSLNVRSEPMVCSPLDAIRCFYSTGMDALAIGDFLLTK